LDLSCCNKSNLIKDGEWKIECQSCGKRWERINSENYKDIGYAEWTKLENNKKVEEGWTKIKNRLERELLIVKEFYGP